MIIFEHSSNPIKMSHRISLFGKPIVFQPNMTINAYSKNNARMHPALIKSLADFYGYASDAAGIRHDANNRDFEEGYEEAKMILVNMSSFVNYLITTADTSEAEDQ